MSLLYHSLIRSNRIFFVICAALAFVLLVDSNLVKISTFLSLVDDQQKFYIFTSIAISFIIAQHFILSYSGNTLKNIKSWTKSRLLHTIVVLTYYFLTILLLIMISDIFLNSRYYTFALILILIISYAVSCIAMGLLAFQFFRWFKAKKFYIVLLYSISCSVFVISNAFIMVFVGYIIPQRGDIIEPHGHIILYFNDPGSLEYYLYNGYVISSILSFIFFWLTTSALLYHYSKRIGNIMYWVIVCVPLVYFLSQFSPLLSNTLSSLTAQDPFVYGVLFSIIFSISKSLGGILFATAFWFMSRVITKNDLLKDLLLLVAIGFVLLYISEQAISLTQGPYPPYGITSVATLGLASYLILIGLYYSVISVASDIRIRKLIFSSTMRELDLLGKMGYAQMEEEVEDRVIGILKQHSDEIDDDAPFIRLSTDQIREYTKQVLDEVKRSSDKV